MKLQSPLPFIVILCLFTGQRVAAQDKHTVQLEVFDQQLKPLPNIELSLNGKEFLAIGKNGSVYVELDANDLPPQAVKIKNDQLEAASWNYSKGILEIIVRKKSYEMVEFLVQDN